MKNYEYEHVQLTVALRSQNNIRAHKVLDIQGNDLVIKLWMNSEKTERFRVPEPEAYKVGEYLDFIILRTGKTSHTTKLIGKTPIEFIPVDGADIS